MPNFGRSYAENRLQIQGGRPFINPLVSVSMVLTQVEDGPMTAALKAVPGNPATQRSDEEWRLRRELAACYRLIAHFKMTDLIFTHISVRIPGPEHHFLINPYGLFFDEITASNLVKIGLDGRAVEPSPHPVNPDR